MKNNIDNENHVNVRDIPEDDGREKISQVLMEMEALLTGIKLENQLINECLRTTYKNIASYKSLNDKFAMIFPYSDAIICFQSGISQDLLLSCLSLLSRSDFFPVDEFINDYFVDSLFNFLSCSRKVIIKRILYLISNLAKKSVPFCEFLLKKNAISAFCNYNDESVISVLQVFILYASSQEERDILWMQVQKFINRIESTHKVLDFVAYCIGKEIFIEGFGVLLKDLCMYINSDEAFICNSAIKLAKIIPEKNIDVAIAIMNSMMKHVNTTIIENSYDYLIETYDIWCGYGYDEIIEFITTLDKELMYEVEKKGAILLSLLLSFENPINDNVISVLEKFLNEKEISLIVIDKCLNALSDKIDNDDYNDFFSLVNEIAENLRVSSLDPELTVLSSKYCEIIKNLHF